MCVQPLPVTNRIYSCWTDNLMKPYPLGISWGMAKQEGRSWEGEGGGGSPIKRSPFDSEGEKKTAFASRVLTHCIRRTTFTFGPFFCQSSLDFSSSCSLVSEWPMKQSQNNFCWGGGGGGPLYCSSCQTTWILLATPAPAPARVDYTLEVRPWTMSVRLGKQFADNWNNLSLSFQSASLANMSTIHDLEDPKNFVPIPQTVFCLSII